MDIMNTSPRVTRVLLPLLVVALCALTGCPDITLPTAQEEETPETPSKLGQPTLELQPGAAPNGVRLAPVAPSPVQGERYKFTPTGARRTFEAPELQNRN